MKASAGIGRGRNAHGGKRPGAGRPEGAINKRTLGMLAEAASNGKQLPLDYLLEVMRDPKAEEKSRLAAASIAAPYCHARLQVLQVFSDPERLDDAQLMLQVGRLERHAAKLSAPSPVTIDAKVDSLVETTIPALPYKQQVAACQRLMQAAAEALQRLNDPNRPGAVAPRYTHQQAPAAPADAAPAPSAAPNGPIRRPGADAAPVPAKGRRLRYDPVSGELVEPV